MQERTFVDAHGVEVFSRWWLVDDPAGLVVISHGASEHSGRYGRFAAALNDAGYAVVAIDHRGHGRTGAATGAGMMGPGAGQAVVDDLDELRALALAEIGADVPVVLFGHSLGAVIGLAYVVQHTADLTAAVLCGFPVDVNGVAGLGELLGGLAEAGLRDAPASDLLASNNAPFEPGRTGFDWLSRDEAEVDRYIADPLCGDENPLTYGYLIDLFAVVAPARDALGSISVPVLVIAGDKDSAAENGAHPTALAEALRTEGVATDLTLYPDARHELLNETNRDEVTADVVGWVRAKA